VSGLSDLIHIRYPACNLLVFHVFMRTFSAMLRSGDFDTVGKSLRLLRSLDNLGTCLNSRPDSQIGSDGRFYRFLSEI